MQNRNKNPKNTNYQTKVRLRETNKALTQITCKTETKTLSQTIKQKSDSETNQALTQITCKTEAKPQKTQTIKQKSDSERPIKH